jgi:DNA-binding transcriptional ArsR family regulator
MTVQQVFSTLANETRLRCLHLVLRRGEVCVCELVDALGVSQPTVSKAMAALRQAGFVVDRRDATWTYYRRNPDMPVWQRELVATLSRHLAGEQPFVDDLQNFVPQMSRVALR